MAADRFAALRRSLSVSPSRRDLGRGLVGFAAGSMLAPLFGLADGQAGDNKKKRHNRNKNKKKRCSRFLLEIPCRLDKSGCCDVDQICTTCGCCAAGETLCCATTKGRRMCCPPDSTCCWGSNGIQRCCPPGESCCKGAGGVITCCAAETPCCGGVCCPSGTTCTDGCCCTPGNVCCDINGFRICQPACPP
jgi:hypothetical protein